ncbi:MAG: hypothetical protein ACRD4W_05275 [Nitrososphaeraceae archaeon]
MDKHEDAIPFLNQYNSSDKARIRKYIQESSGARERDTISISQRN